MAQGNSFRSPEAAGRRSWWLRATPAGRMLWGAVGLVLLFLVPWRGEEEVRGVFRPYKGEIQQVKAPAGGRIRLAVARHQQVGSGQLLFTVASTRAEDVEVDRTLAVQLMSLRSDRNQLERQVEDCRRQEDDFHQRQSQGRASAFEWETLQRTRRELEQRLQELERQESRLKEEAERQTAREDRMETPVCASQPGQVYDLAVEQGAPVAPDAPCLTLVPDGAILQLSAMIPDRLARRLREGGSARVKGPDFRNAPGAWFDATLKVLYPNQLSLEEARAWVPSLPAETRGYRRALIEKSDAGCIWLPFNQPIRIRIQRPWRPWIVHLLT